MKSKARTKHSPAGSATAEPAPASAPAVLADGGASPAETPPSDLGAAAAQSQPAAADEVADAQGAPSPTTTLEPGEGHECEGPQERAAAADAADTTDSADAADTTDSADAADTTDSADAADTTDQANEATPPSTEEAAPQEGEALRRILESLIFAADKALTTQQLRRITGASGAAIESALARSRELFGSTGIELVSVGGGHHFRTDPQHAHWVRQLFGARPQRLTRPMLEALAIIAYRQPVTRPEVEDIRGVDCGGTLRLLLERNLIRIIGKKEDVGRPLLYGTTKHFLEFFQLRDLKGLPTLREFAELSEDHQRELDARYGAPAAGAAAIAAIAADDVAAAESGPAATMSVGEAEAPLPDALTTTDTGELAHSDTAAATPLAPRAGAPGAALSEIDDNEVLDALDRAIARADALLGGERGDATQPAEPNDGGPEGDPSASAPASAGALDPADPPEITAERAAG